MELTSPQFWDALSPEELRNRSLDLATLVEITRDLAAEIDLDRILQTVAQEACKALHCERASVFQYDEKLQELFTRVATQLEIAEIRTSVNQGITGHVARTRKLTNVSDPARDPRWNSSVDLATGFRTHNILACPITSPHEHRLLGVLELINKEKGSFDWFDEQLVEAFSQHAAVALDRARLIHELKKRHAMQASLNVARQIQRDFMPTRLPQVDDYEMATWWFPNEAVGGDYCDVIAQRDGRTALIIADVSGHGLGPSLIMASVRAGLRALMLEHTAPEVLLRLLARSMAQDLRDGRFITMVFAALDSQAHTVEFANAGHAPALHYIPAQQRFCVLEATGVPLGVLDRPEYPQGPPLRMAVGDLVVLCTDGIVEAMDEHGEQFGLRRLQDIVAEQARAPVRELVRQVGAQVEAYYQGESPPDDLTILAVRRNA